MEKKKQLVDVTKEIQVMYSIPETRRILETDHVARKIIDWFLHAPTVDAVPVADIEAWLYQIAMNNTGNPLCEACEEIIRRLDGLRTFSRERDNDNA